MISPGIEPLSTERNRLRFFQWSCEIILIELFGAVEGKIKLKSETREQERNQKMEMGKRQTSAFFSGDITLLSKKTTRLI
jgi:hypothetical protein